MILVGVVKTTSVYKSVCKVVGATLIVVLLATSVGAQEWTHIPSTDPGWITNAEFPDWIPHFGSLTNMLNTSSKAHKSDYTALRALRAPRAISK
ncbi:MAG: hypothetical protein ACYSR3_11955 [Planctomycetota bacterium]